MSFGDERADSPGPPPPRPHIPEHTGPELLAGDTWAVDGGAGGDDAYEGRRRAAVLTNRRWIPVIAVLAGLAVAIAVPIILSSSPPGSGTAGTVTQTDPGEAPIGVDGTSSDATTSTAVDQTSQPATTPPTTIRPTTTRVRTTTTKPPTTAFSPVTYQAEAPSNTIRGSAHVSAYAGASGGRIVRNIGDWGNGPDDGLLRFNGVTVPAAGTYTITLYVVHIDNETNRTALVSTNGAPPVTVVDVGSATCCATKTITVTLAKGANTITITNPNGHAPSIDRIVVRRP